MQVPRIVQAGVEQDQTPPSLLQRRTLEVALASPDNFHATDDLKTLMGFNVVARITTADDMAEALNRYYPEESAETINDLIRSLQRALGVTSIVVTHDIQSAYKVGDRIAFLSEGVLCFVGTVAEARKSEEPRLRRFLEGGE